MPTNCASSSTVSTTPQWPMQIRQKDSFSCVAMVVPRYPLAFGAWCHRPTGLATVQVVDLGSIFVLDVLWA
jgi:hypothetical protein